MCVAISSGIREIRDWRIDNMGKIIKSVKNIVKCGIKKAVDAVEKTGDVVVLVVKGVICMV